MEKRKRAQLKMPQINAWHVSGRLVYPGEARTSPKGTAYARNRLAVDCGFGEKRQTSFFSIVAFGRQAEALSRMGKGEAVYVEGRLTINAREKGDEVVEMPEITAYRVEALTWPDDADAPDEQRIGPDEADVPF